MGWVFTFGQSAHLTFEFYVKKQQLWNLNLGKLGGNSV